jgi:orotidine-5'-phosphate decarboxylase
MNSSPNTFTQQLQSAWASQGSMLCVGFDPDPKRLPAVFQGKPEGIFEFCREIADATADTACSFKPQFAYFASQRAEAQLEKLTRYLKDKYPHIPVILDSKRGDIGSTADHYALEAFERYGADAVTVNPYMGFDTIEPYLKHAGKGVIVLCRTSNPGGSDLQFLNVSPKGEPLYLHVARLAAQPSPTKLPRSERLWARCLCSFQVLALRAAISMPLLRLAVSRINQVAA